jgi:hypothetical protein
MVTYDNDFDALSPLHPPGITEILRLDHCPDLISYDEHHNYNVQA